MTINYSIFKLIFSVAHKNPLLDGAIIFFATYLPYIMGIIFLWFLLARYSGDWRASMMFFSESALAVILSRGIFTEAIRFIVPNPRPHMAMGFDALITQGGSSFPSAHATILFTLAMMLWYFNRGLSRWFFAAAIINGIARVAAGVHWPLDILGGIGVGILSSLLIHELVKPYRESLFKKKTQAS